MHLYFSTCPFGRFWCQKPNLWKFINSVLHCLSIKPLYLYWIFPTFVLFFKIQVIYLSNPYNDMTFKLIGNMFNFFFFLKAKHPNLEISQCMFERLKPFYIRHLKERIQHLLLYVYHSHMERICQSLNKMKASTSIFHYIVDVS